MQMCWKGAGYIINVECNFFKRENLESPNPPKTPTYVILLLYCNKAVRSPSPIASASDFLDLVFLCMGNVDFPFQKWLEVEPGFGKANDRRRQARRAG